MELEQAPDKKVRPSPMFIIKKIKAITSPRPNVEKTEHEAFNKILVSACNRTLAENNVLNDCSRSSIISERAIMRASTTLKYTEKMVHECHNVRDTFFKARHSIATSASSQAKLNNIDFELVDVDSEEDREAFFTGRNLFNDAKCYRTAALPTPRNSNSDWFNQRRALSS